MTNISRLPRLTYPTLARCGDDAFFDNYAAELAHKHGPEEFNAAREEFTTEVRTRLASYRRNGMKETEAENYLIEAGELFVTEFNLNVPPFPED